VQEMETAYRSCSCVAHCWTKWHSGRVTLPVSNRGQTSIEVFVLTNHGMEGASSEGTAQWNR
jgi:hypothetical protein